jgi:hypothetical protein
LTSDDWHDNEGGMMLGMMLLLIWVFLFALLNEVTNLRDRIEVLEDALLEDDPDDDDPKRMAT